MPWRAGLAFSVSRILLLLQINLCRGLPVRSFLIIFLLVFSIVQRLMLLVRLIPFSHYLCTMNGFTS